MASTMRCARSPVSWRVLAAGSMASRLAGRPARGEAVAENEEGAPRGALVKAGVAVASGRRRRLGLGRRRGRDGRGGVVELLLGPEQRIEHLRAQALAERERQPGADRQQQELAAQAPLAPALLRPLLERN